MSSVNLKSYIQKYETVQSERDLTVNKLKKAFFFRLKQTRVLVMMNDDDKNFNDDKKIENYRPISRLPCCSKNIGNNNAQ